MEYLLLRNDKDCFLHSKNSLSGSLELKQNGEFIVSNYFPCKTISKSTTGVISICLTKVESVFQIDEYILILEGEKYNIDVLNEQFLYLRSAKNE
jgi:hypothetical protein